MQMFQLVTIDNCLVLLHVKNAKLQRVLKMPWNINRLTIFFPHKQNEMSKRS